MSDFRKSFIEWTMNTFQLKLWYSPPALIRKMYSDFHWETKTGELLLTFDDGPTSGVTEKIIRKLDDYNIKALFFCVGENLNKFESTAKMLIDEGHTLANHTYHHKKITTLSDKSVSYEVKETNNAIQTIGSNRATYFRPPYGRFSKRSVDEIQKLNLEVVMWSLLTYDWEGNFQQVKKIIGKYLTSGNIIVFHDNIKSEPILEDALDFLFEFADKKQLTFGNPESCLN